MADLERRLAETREQGVQATKEVQVAAQRIVHENTRLRQLLRLNGIGSEAIDAWVRQDDGLSGGQNLHPPTRQLGCTTECEKVRAIVFSIRDAWLMLSQDSTCSPTAKRVTTDIGRVQTGTCNSSSDAIASQAVATSTRACQTRLHSMESSVDADISTKSPAIPKDHTVYKSEQFPTVSHGVKLSSDISADLPTSRAHIPLPRTEAVIPPCKLLTLLAKDPAADITQRPLSPRSESEGCNSKNTNSSPDGVECSAAYKLLIQYATSEGKMDDIAKALEEGCTPTQGGGCKVKTKAIWEALDNVCQ